MNDRFKFRFWNKTRKIMETFNNSPLTLGGLLLGKNDDYEILSCTGSKDKNGKLIYDRDIIRFKDNVTINGSKTHIAVVEHNEAFNAFMYHAECMGLYTVNKAQNEKFDVEVIGNIYENKSLLESEEE